MAINKYQTRTIVKVALFVVAMSIVALSLLYTDNLAKNLKEDERSKVALWAEATRLIGLKNFKKMINFKHYPSLEAQISAISDDIAYNNHDIQDGINANLFKIEELTEINFFKDIYKKYKKIINKQNYKIVTYQVIRNSIDLMIKDLINNTKKNLKIYKINSINDFKNAKNTIVNFSEKIQKSEKEIKSFLRFNMYNNKEVLNKNENGKKIIKKLFKIIKSNPRKFIKDRELDKNKFRSISDFISGMTDRYAINLYKNLK